MTRYHFQSIRINFNIQFHIRINLIKFINHLAPHNWQHRNVSTTTKKKSQSFPQKFICIPHECLYAENLHVFVLYIAHTTQKSLQHNKNSTKPHTFMRLRYVMCMYRIWVTIQIYIAYMRILFRFVIVSDPLFNKKKKWKL